MLVVIIVTLLVLGIAFFQSTQGWFSSLIMAILTVCCAMLAFNYYEPLAQAILIRSQPAYADGICLVTLFFIPLLVLRIVCDMVMGANVVSSLWGDRVGGGLLGLFTALVAVGVLMVAVQMLPWGTTILGFNAYKPTLERDTGLFPYPDEFTIGLVNLASSGSLEVDPARPYGNVHDDLLLELWCARNTGANTKGESLNGSVQATPDGFSVVGAYAPPANAGGINWSDVPPYHLLGETPTQVVVVRCKIDESAGAQDEDQKIRLAGTQFRLVSMSNHSYYPVAFLDHAAVKPGEKDVGAWALHTPPGKDNPEIGNLVVVRNSNQVKSMIVDWVYRVPVDEKLAGVFFRKVGHWKVNPPLAEMPPDDRPPAPEVKPPLDLKATNENFKKSVTEYFEAMKSKDYPKMADLLLPEIIKEAGGREKTIAALRIGFEPAKVVLPAKMLDESGQILDQDGQAFGAVGYVANITAPGTGGEVHGTMIGVSGDAGKTWKLIDGTTEGKQTFAKLYPKAMPTLKMPESYVVDESGKKTPM